MSKKSEPWYIHAILYVIIIVLAYVLIRVAIIEPTEIIEAEAYYKSESRLRMANIKSAEIIWEERFGSFTDNLNDLVEFIKKDTVVKNLITGTDTITGRSSNPFKNLTVGTFVPDSLFGSPKSFSNYILNVDSTVTLDTVINRRGRITKIDTVRVYGTLYYLECPDGYGSVGAIDNNALKNTASWGIGNYMSLLQDHAGLNITGSKLRFVEVNFENDKLLLENVDEEPLTEYLTCDISSRDFIDALQLPFNNIISRKPLYSKRISVTLPDEYFKIFSFPLEQLLTNEDLNGHTNWEFATLFPNENITEYAIQSINLPVTELSPKPKVLIYAIRKELLKTIRQFSVNNNLELNYIDNAHVASDSLLQPGNTPGKFYLSLYIYEKSISFLLLNGNIPIYRSSKKMASIYIVESIIASEITKLNDLGISLSKISKCFSAGENLSSEQIEQISQAAGAELTAFNPFENIKTAPTITSSKYVNELSNSFAAAAGIALRLV